jgi:hypothetical protein
MKWITRERPKIDRIACPWLIKNFADKEATFIDRGADTYRFELSPQSAGLWCISAGLSHNYKNDNEMPEVGMKIYDALYSRAKYVQDERHTWNPDLLKT